MSINRVGAIDLGTNSFLCLIAEINVAGELKVVQDLLRIVRLGEGVHKTRKFSAEALLRADQALADFRKALDLSGVTRVKAVATSAARDVDNGGALLSLGKKWKIPIEVISGEEEAKLTFRGAVGGIGDSPGTAVIDVGGGSTELIHEWHDKEIHEVSWDIGCVRLTEKHVTMDPPSSKCVDSIFLEARATIKPLREERPDRLIAVAGTPTTLAAMEQGIDFDPDRIEGFSLTAGMLDNWIGRLSNETLEQKKLIKGLHPGRADILLAGAIILRVALERLDLVEMKVSTKGIRYGLAQHIGEGVL